MRGDVYLATLSPRSGSEQMGTRPVVVVSNDGFNNVPKWRSVIVVPCSTSKSQATRGPTVVALSKNSGGLKKASIVVCHQITTLDRSKLTKRIGALSAGEMLQVEEAIKAALDLP